MISEVIAVYHNIPGRSITINYKPVKGFILKVCHLFKDALANLVDSAIKHSTGPLTVCVRLNVVNDGDKDLCSISVEDNGPGISDVLKDKIFNRFKKESVKASGSGLGLYLVKLLVEEFYGKVWVEDRVPGDHAKGSKFVVAIPAVAK